MIESAAADRARAWALDHWAPATEQGDARVDRSGFRDDASHLATLADPGQPLDVHCSPHTAPGTAFLAPP
jgi:hypothetical protein